MVKEKKIGFSELLKLPFGFNVFKEKNYEICKKSAIIYVISLILISAIILGLHSLIPQSQESFITNFFGALIMIPIIILIFYSLFYVLLNAYENKSKNYLEGLLIFTSSIMPFFLDAYILSLIEGFIFSYSISTLINLIILAIMIYMLVNLTINYKNYANSTYPRIISSLLIANLMISISMLTVYMNFIIGALA